MSGVVGIDFGTQTCTMAQAKRGTVDTMLNEASKRQTSALVSFQGKQRFMGEQAVPLVSSNYKNTVSTIKRFIGKSWSDPSVQNDITFCANRAAFKELDGDKIGIEVRYQDELMVMSPEDICAMLIGSLKRTAEFSNEGRAVSDLVFSVPAYWNDRQRRSFLASAKIANVDVLGLINDGTSAALSFGIWKSLRNQFGTEKEHVMFVDMGYAGFQVTIAAFVQGKLSVVTSACDGSLGGRDIDMAVAKHFAAQFEAKHKMDPLTNPKSALKLIAQCEKAKQTLTPEGVTLANVNVEFLMEEIDFSSKLTLDEFDEIIAPIVDRVVPVLERAMEESGLTMEDISAVEILGGSTRVRAIKKRIAETLGLDLSKPSYGLSTTQNADECIARGCALRCAMLSPAIRVKEFIVADSVRLPINVTWEQTEAGTDAMEDEEVEEDEAAAPVGENTVKIFEKGVEVPLTRRIIFRRSNPFEVAASYAEETKSEFASEDELLIGTFRISGMPASTSTDGNPPKIRLDFKQDEFGLFQVVKAEQLQEIVPEGKDGDDEAANEGAGSSEAKEDAGKEASGEAKEGDEAKEAEKKKKKFRVIKLDVDASFYKGFTSENIMNSRSREVEYADHDRVIKETSDMKNRVESYVYSMRDKVDGSLKEFGTEEERAQLSKVISETSEWIYEDGFDVSKQEYEAKYKEVSSLGKVFEDRALEAEERPKAAERLRDEIAANMKIVNSVDEQYAHIEDSERDKVREICDEAEKWVSEMLGKQADKPTYEDPVVTAAEILARMNTVNTNCRPIVTKRKPPPPKKEESKKEEKEGDAEAAETEENGAAEEQDTGDAAPEAAAEDMDVD